MTPTTDGGLAATVGYTLENEAYRCLPDLLRRDYGIEVENRCTAITWR